MTKTLKLSGKTKTIDLAKQVAEHVAMLPDMIEKCSKHFIPQVQTLLAWPEEHERFVIEFIEAMPMTQGLMFEMQIDIEGLNLYELKITLASLECLCSWEPSTPDMCGFTLNGYSFQMGDGDDMGAVYIRNGKLCVWVRAWKD